MRICFVSRRFFPAISGMSVYALNLLRELAGAGHDVTMISQYRGDAFGMRVYGGGPPPPVPGVRVIGLEQVGEQTNGDFERDVEAMVEAGLAGLEVDHRDHSDAERAHLRDLASSLDLLITGSSDYHGEGKPNRLGEHRTCRRSFDAIVEQATGSEPVVGPGSRLS